MRSRWRRAIKPRRLWLMVRCLGPLHAGVTIVIVNWDSLSYLRTTLAAVHHFSPPTTRILVVDNGSTDGSVEWLREHDVRTVALDANWGHEAGLDLGWLRARTRTVVALDVDAFPISHQWVPQLTEPLASGATVVGARGGEHVYRLALDASNPWRGRDYVRPPCCLAIRDYAASASVDTRNSSSPIE